jgi:hypothetical protein
MLYFIEAVGPDHIKIGFTAKPMEKRLAMLQTGNSYPLRVLGTASGSLKDEYALRRTFRRHLVRGEWFRPTPGLLEQIYQRTEQYEFITCIDRKLGTKLTRDTLRAVPACTDVFLWQKLIDEAAGRLRAGQDEDEVAKACRLDVDEGSEFCGWVKGRSRKHHRPVYHLLFTRRDGICRYTAQFVHGLFPDMWYLPGDMRALIPGTPEGVRSVCKAVWGLTVPEWYSHDSRIYL